MDFLIKSNSTKTINRVLGKSLLINPNEIDLWTFAAYYEFDINNNIQNSRELFQKCIRINERNLNAHLAYFLFEIVFVEKILKRRMFLKEKDLEFINNEGNIENSDGIQSISTVDDEVLGLFIPRVIFDNAINVNSHKDDCEYNQMIDLFLEKLREHSPNLENNEKTLIEYINSKRRIDVKMNLILKSLLVQSEIEDFKELESILVDIPNNLSVILNNNHVLMNKLTLKKSFETIYQSLFEYYQTDIKKVIYEIIKSFPKSHSLLPTIISYCLNEVFEYDLLNFHQHLNGILQIFIDKSKEMNRTIQIETFKEILYYIIKYLLQAESDIIVKNNEDMLNLKTIVNNFNKENSKKLINFSYLFEDVILRFRTKGFNYELKIKDIRNLFLN